MGRTERVARVTGVYFYNEKTGRRYDVLKFDKERGKILLKGKISEFEEDFNKEKLARMGYTLRKE
jgi:hypothetical protein